MVIQGVTTTNVNIGSFKYIYKKNNNTELLGLWGTRMGNKLREGGGVRLLHGISTLLLPLNRCTQKKNSGPFQFECK